MECVNLNGDLSSACIEARPQVRRHCAGPCLSDNPDVKGWTKVIDTKIQSLFFDEEIQQQLSVANATSKAEFLEVSRAQKMFLNCYVFVLVIFIFICCCY